jgi:hypothetical protein
MAGRGGGRSTASSAETFQLLKIALNFRRANGVNIASAKCVAALVLG